MTSSPVPANSALPAFGAAASAIWCLYGPNYIRKGDTRPNAAPRSLQRVDIVPHPRVPFVPADVHTSLLSDPVQAAVGPRLHQSQRLPARGRGQTCVQASQLCVQWLRPRTVMWTLTSNGDAGAASRDFCWLLGEVAVETHQSDNTGFPFTQVTFARFPPLRSSLHIRSELWVKSWMAAITTVCTWYQRDQINKCWQIKIYRPH